MNRFWIFLFISAVQLLLSCVNNSGDEIPEFSASPAIATEGIGESLLTWDITLSSVAQKDITLDHEVVGLTAAPGIDFIGVKDKVTIVQGSRSAIVSIRILEDDENELDETVLLKISDTSTMTGQSHEFLGTIKDNNSPMPSNDGYITALRHYGYSLSWSDEFDEEISSEYYNYEIGDGCPNLCGWGNNELQSYTSSSEQSFIKEGKLVISASRDGTGYRSARIVTRGKQEFQFGRIDIRAKLPEGQGIWPAIWMLGSNIGEVGWPHCGEIDIMELVGHEPSVVHGTAHWGPQGRGYSTHKGANKRLSQKLSSAFHVFTLLWEKDKLSWYLDEELFHTLTRKDVSDSDYPFNAPFFFIFNIAVGGDWPGHPDHSTSFPQTMEIDYIRVFQ